MAVFGPLVHEYDDTPLAVNKALFPEHITELLALIEIVGLGLAVIVTTEFPIQPLASEPITLYVVFAVGDTVYVVLFELSVHV